MRKILIGLALLVALAIGGLTQAVRSQTTTFGVPSTSGTTEQFLQFQDNFGNVKGTSTLSGTSLNLNSTSTVTRISHFSMTVTPTSVAATTCNEQPVTISGLTSNDALFVNPAPISGAVTIYVGPLSFVAARVSTSDTAAFRYCNWSGATQTISAGTFTGFVIRKS